MARAASVLTAPRQQRFEAKPAHESRQLAERLFERGDGTLSYFFSIGKSRERVGGAAQPRSRAPSADDVERLARSCRAAAAPLSVARVEIVERVVVNHATSASMQRRFVQATLQRVD